MPVDLLRDLPRANARGTGCSSARRRVRCTPPCSAAPFHQRLPDSPGHIRRTGGPARLRVRGRHARAMLTATQTVLPSVVMGITKGSPHTRTSDADPATLVDCDLTASRLRCKVLAHDGRHHDGLCTHNEQQRCQALRQLEVPDLEPDHAMAAGAVRQRQAVTVAVAECGRIR